MEENDFCSELPRIAIDQGSLPAAILLLMRSDGLQDGGMSEILFVMGHIRKLIKVSRRRENTHSKYGDRRMGDLWIACQVLWMSRLLHEWTIGFWAAIPRRRLWNTQSPGNLVTR